MQNFIVLKCTYVTAFVRDSLFTDPTFDFHFKIMLPKANKERLIMERDIMGRILSSKVPEQYHHYAEK